MKYLVATGGFPDNILQGWFKMKTTSIFPVHGLASLLLMSKYAHSQQFFRGFPDNILQAIMSDNREKQFMLYFTNEVFSQSQSRTEKMKSRDNF